MADYKIKVVRELAPIDSFINSDDWGIRVSMFISPALHRELIKPQMIRISKFAHDNGKYIDFHSCGKCGALVPDMAEMGAYIHSFVDSYTGESGLLTAFAGTAILPP